MEKGIQIRPQGRCQMKRRIRFAAIAVMTSFVASADVWPDGSKMDVWFADRSPVDETRLGRLRRTEEFGAKPDKEEMQTAILQRAIDTIAAEGGVLVFGSGAWNTSSLFFKPGVHLKLEKGAVLRGPEDGSVVPRGMTHFVGHSLCRQTGDACGERRVQELQREGQGERQARPVIHETGRLRSAYSFYVRRLSRERT